MHALLSEAQKSIKIRSGPYLIPGPSPPPPPQTPISNTAHNIMVLLMTTYPENIGSLEEDFSGKVFKQNIMNEVRRPQQCVRVRALKSTATIIRGKWEWVCKQCKNHDNANLSLPLPKNSQKEDTTTITSKL